MLSRERFGSAAALIAPTVVCGTLKRFPVDLNRGSLGSHRLLPASHQCRLSANYFAPSLMPDMLQYERNPL